MATRLLDFFGDLATYISDQIKSENMLYFGQILINIGDIDTIRIGLASLFNWYLWNDLTCRSSQATPTSVGAQNASKRRTPAWGEKVNLAEWFNCFEITLPYSSVCIREAS